MRNLILILFVILFTGCDSKKYFEPDTVEGSVYSSGYLPDYVKDTKRDGLTLENNQVITKDGLSDIKVSEGFLYINDTSEYILAVDNTNQIEYINKSTKNRKTVTFQKKVVSATITTDVLVVVTLDNTIYIYDLNKKEIIEKLVNSETNAIDSRLANPMIVNSLLMVPTLDGKLVIFDKNTNKYIKTMTIDTNQYFSNIIFLKVVNDRLIVATQNNILSISSDGTDYNELSIRDVAIFKNNIYVFSRDGNIHFLDDDLSILKSKKLKFAIFTGLIGGEYIYAIEKDGYLIAIDEDLITANVLLLFEISNLCFLSSSKASFTTS
jgi:WD40 repeat protein